MNKIILFLIAGCFLSQIAYAERPMNELPMYGGQHNPTVKENPEFSRGVVKQGWKAYYRGDLDTAMKRFNQGWMFDRENSEVFWGFGLIIGQRASEGDPEKDLEESIRFLKIAHIKASGNGRIIGDLAYSHTVLGNYFQSEKGNDQKAQVHFQIAGGLFREAFIREPQYPPILAAWSTYYFYMDNYQEAKIKADKAIKIGYQFGPDYIKELEGKLN